MRVFLSWSGEQSRRVALALSDWLPYVINTAEPFVSSKDIHAGVRWQAEIADHLSASQFGIVCVTKANQAAQWLNFEAGALAKAVDVSRVVPLAVDLKPSDITLPLGQFQAQPASEEGVGEIVKSINACCPKPLDPGLLRRATAKWWPELESDLIKISELTAGPAESILERTDRELLEEVLGTVRGLARRLDRAEEAMAPDPVSPDHPVIDDLRDLLNAHDVDGEIVHHTSRRMLAVRLPRGQYLPVSLQQAVRELLEKHDIAASFLTRRGRRAGSDDQMPTV